MGSGISTVSASPIRTAGSSATAPRRAIARDRGARRPNLGGAGSVVDPECVKIAHAIRCETRGMPLRQPRIVGGANAEGVSYNFNTTESAYTTGLPIIPSLWLRGEV